MGVKISKLVEPVKVEITIKNLLGKTIAIDAFNSIYQFLATIRQQDGTPLKDYSGNVTSHLKGLLYRTINLIENDVKPIYVFDGPPHELKLKTIQQRKLVREEHKKKMEEAQDAEDDKEAKKHAQATSKLTSEMIEESKLLLDYMGVPWVEAAHDGEAEAARLIKKGIVWASASQDYDSMLFGADRLVRNLTINRKRKIGNITTEISIEYYSLNKILQYLEITHDQLIDLGILIGVDFFEGFPGVGEKTALKLIKQYGNIENIMKNEVKIKGTPIYIETDLLNKLRSIFKNIEKPAIEKKIKWRAPNEDKIKELLVEKHNFSEKLLDSAIEKLKQKRASKMQVSLDKFLK
ncbi:MAG: flap endonuclease-1 [Promethearchaeota archaeon]